jgi:thiol-disulfide isomerase/thioredoxin
MLIVRRFLTISLIFFLQQNGNGQSNLLTQESPIPELDLSVITNIQTGEIQQEKLSNSNGKIRILDFWATWCGPCIAKMSDLQKLKNEFPNDLEIISISDETIEKILPFVQKRNLPFRFVVDKESVISNKFEVGALPFTILIDKKGIIKKINGSYMITPNVMRDLIEDKPVILPKPPVYIPSKSTSDTAIKGIKSQYIFTKYQSNVSSFAKDEMKGEYAGRRVMIYNLSLKGIVNVLSNYGQANVSNYDNSEFEKENLYCLDMIFEDKNAPQRSQLALEFLLKKFPEKIKIKSEKVKGYVLELGDKAKIPEVAEKNVEFVSTATTQDLAQSLSRLMQVPVKNGLNYNHRFILTMSRIPNEMSKINLIMGRIGLVLVEKEFTRNIYTVN